MVNVTTYDIYKLPVWIRYFYSTKQFRKLSEILTGQSNYILENTLYKKFKKYEIEGNTEQDGEPIPENPIPIQNVKGTIVNKVSNKNLVNINEITSKTSSVIELGEYNNFREGQEITFSGKLDLGNTVKAGRARLQIKYNDGTSDRYIGEWVSGTGIKKSYGSFTVTSNVSQILLQFQTNDADVRFFDIQLENGLVATNYIPHLEQTADFTLQENQYLALNDTLEDDGIHHKRKQEILDGTEQWELVENTEHVFFTTKDNIKSGLSYCTHFIGVTQEIEANDYTIMTDNQGIYVNYKDVTTPVEFQQFLNTENANHTPVIVEYDLETEEIESYTTSQQEQYNAIKKLKTYKDLTVVEAESSDLSPILTIQYWQKNINEANLNLSKVYENNEEIPNKIEIIDNENVPEIEESEENGNESN